MDINCINENSALLPAIVSLGDENSEFLGFFAAKAFQRAASVGNILAASSDGELLGYLLYYVAKSRVVIQHLCVAKAHQRKGIGRGLLDELKRKTSQYRGILLHCNRTFPAYKTWLQLGFVPLGEKRGRGKAENTLTRFWMDYGHPDLLTDAINRSLEDRTRVVLDLNILYDLHDFGTRPQDSKSLTADWIKDSLALLITDEVFVEIDRLDDTQDRKIQKDKARGYAQLAANPANVDAYLTSLKSILPDDHMASDRRHLAITASAGVRYFITRDDILTAHADDIFASTGVKPMHPTAFILHFAESQDEYDYEPICLSGSAVAVQRVGASHFQEIMECFLDAPHGETKAKFNERLRGALGRPDLCEAWFTKHYGKISGLYVVVRNGKNRWSVPFFRVATNNLSGVIARNLVMRLVQLVAQSPASVVTIDDPHCSDVVSHAMAEVGFQNINGVIARITISGIHTRDSVFSHLARLKNDDVAFGQMLDNLERDLTSALQPEASLLDIARIHRKIWPGKADEGSIPCFIVPIQPNWAIHLFDGQLARQQLFHAMTLSLNWEQAYYRSAIPKVLESPARILWYVSHDEKFVGTGAIRACSTLEEVTIGSAKDVEKKFRRLGVFEWSNVKEIADRSSTGEVMGFRFGMTENFQVPVYRDEVHTILHTTMGTEPPLSTAVRVPSEAFVQIYNSGNQHVAN